MEQTIEIRRASDTDWNVLQALGRETFRETFAESNTAEDMERYLEEHFSEKKLRDELAQSEFFIAYRDETPVGFIKLNVGAAQTEAHSPEAMELERIYTLKDCHGQGVGKQLLDCAISKAREGGYPSLWLGVWEHNARALRFYERNGFEPFGDHEFVLGADVQRDVLMRLTFED